MSTTEYSVYLFAAAGAAVGAVITSTGRVILHPLTRRAWPYVFAGITGLAMITYDRTRAFGIGLAAYGLAKTIVQAVEQRI